MKELPHQLQLHELAYSYGDKLALSDVSLTAQCGDRLALLGPNGAGKSTLIRVLAGLLKAQRGKITWRGHILHKVSQEIAYLPQVDRHQRNFPLCVRDIVAMGRYPHLGHFKKFRKIDQQKTEAALEAMSLNKIAHTQIDQLSGGQQQRTFIARALAQEAHVILLDEPFNGLDIEGRSHLAASLADLSKRGHLIIASHHQLESVTDIFTHALVLDRRQLDFGPARKVMEGEAVRSTLHSFLPSSDA